MRVIEFEIIVDGDGGYEEGVGDGDGELLGECVETKRYPFFPENGWLTKDVGDGANVDVGDPDRED